MKESMFIVLICGLFPISEAEALRIGSDSVRQGAIEHAIHSGQTVDLRKYGSKRERTLSESDLKRILSENLVEPEAKRLGISLEGVIFQDALNLNDFEYPYDIGFEHCTFESPVDFSRASFKRSISFWTCTFKDSLTLDEAEVQGDLELDSSKCNIVSIRWAKITGWASAEGAAFKEADFEGTSVGRYFSMNGSRVAKTGSFDEMKVSSDAKFSSCSFDGPLSISYTTISGDLLLRFCRIAGSFTVERTRVIGSLYSDHSRFTDSLASVSFVSTQVGEYFSIRHDSFAGGASFVSMVVVGDFYGDSIVFSNRNGGAYFSQMTIGRGAYMSGSTFSLPVYLNNARIEGSLLLQWSNFMDSVTFSNLKVQEDMNLYRCHFEDKASFEYIDVGNNLSLVHSQFANVSKTISFYTARVKSHLWLDQATIAGSLLLKRATVGYNLTFTDARASSIDLTGAKIGGLFTLENATIEKMLDLEDLDAFVVDIGARGYPILPDSVIINGLQYKDIWYRANRCPNPMDSVLSWIDTRVRFSTEAYTTVEHLAEEKGDKSFADHVFISMKSRQGRIGDWLLKVLVGNGRKAYFAFGWGLLFVFIGSVIFRRKRMESQKMDAMNASYNSFWFSLNLFLPAVDLGSLSMWLPKQDETLAWLYYRVLALLGWVLVPLGIASLTGFVK